MRHLLWLVALCGLVWSASAKILVYQVAYKESIDHYIDYLEEEQHNHLDAWTEIVVLQVDDETGEVKGGIGFAYGYEYDEGKKTKETWAEGPWDVEADEFGVGALDAKKAIVVLWGDEPGMGKLKDGMLVSAQGAVTDAEYWVDEFIGAWSATWKLRLDGGLTKKAQEAYDAEDNLDDVMAVLEAYLEQKGFIQD
jgi:hypothetical protein